MRTQTEHPASGTSFDSAYSALDSPHQRLLNLFDHHHLIIMSAVFTGDANRNPEQNGVKSSKGSDAVEQEVKNQGSSSKSP